MLYKILICLLLSTASLYCRTVHGVVKDDNDSPVVAAVVRLKNTTTLRIRSYRTRKGGLYRFSGLDPDMDYELRATHKGRSSGWVSLSRFSEGAERVIDLTVK